MLWKLTCLSALVLGSTLTVSAPQPIANQNTNCARAFIDQDLDLDVSLAAPSSTIPAHSESKRAPASKKRVTVTMTKTNVVTPTPTTSTQPTPTLNVPTQEPETTLVSSTTSEVPVTEPTASSVVWGSNPRSDCSCGYIMSQHNNAYYPKAILVDFSTVSFTDEFAGLGLRVATSRIGGVNQDDKTTACYSTLDNVRITDDGVMELVVPGGQSLGGAITGAEIQSIEKMTSGHLSMTAQLSATHGTCQALFTYIDEAAYPLAGDEQDIEILAHHMEEGVVLTSWNPDTYHTQSEGAVVPYPSPPTVAFHNYTIFWPPADASPRQTSYYFDGQLLTTMSRYVSVHPSGAYINNWSNGQESFTQGPPVADSVLRVSEIAWYYSTESSPGLPSGCSMTETCLV